MNKIVQVREHIKEFPSCLEALFVDFVHEHEGDVVAEQIHQLQLGIMPSGENITPEYGGAKSYWDSPYADFKRYGEGNKYDIPERPYNTPNLGLSGAFYESIGIMYGSDSIQIVATDPKWDGDIAGRTQNLHERYGDVLGLTEEYMKGELADGVKDVIRGRLMDRLRSIV